MIAYWNSPSVAERNVNVDGNAGEFPLTQYTSAHPPSAIVGPDPDDNSRSTKSQADNWNKPQQAETEKLETLKLGDVDEISGVGKDSHLSSNSN